ncbi:hypothetical protein DSO57_1028832 [Entomophthora muscae]|uniref:Uncharacterized protein n=1 Tax=Entomophthora muscae TaxID=34485 RepID=A0ACC2T1G6_9FUNG|nr:hypothetical protein DSO57_1028832 [Entomophthora muscae]
MCYKFEYKTSQLVSASTQEISLFHPPKYFQTCLQTIRSCSQSRAVIQLGSEKPEAKQLNLVELVLAGKPILNNYVKISKQDNLKLTMVPVPGSDPKHQLVPMAHLPNHITLSDWIGTAKSVAPQLSYELPQLDSKLQLPNDTRLGFLCEDWDTTKKSEAILFSYYDVKPRKCHYTFEIMMHNVNHEYWDETYTCPTPKKQEFEPIVNHCLKNNETTMKQPNGIKSTYWACTFEIPRPKVIHKYCVETCVVPSSNNWIVDLIIASLPKTNAVILNHLRVTKSNCWYYKPEIPITKVKCQE